MIVQVNWSIDLINQTDVQPLNLKLPRMLLQNLAMEVEDFRVNLEEQLAEVELLQAMFPGEDELEIEEGGVEEMNAWLSGDTPASLLPSPLELRLRLEVGVGVELIASLPPGYPFKTLPELYLRGDRLSRKAQGEVNGELGRFLTSQVEGETVLVAVVSWLQEQGETLLAPSVEEKTKIENPQIGPQKMLRYWVYSHHIYSKVKRKDLQGLASDLRLSGFVLPGKPGVIAVEVI